MEYCFKIRLKNKKFGPYLLFLHRGPDAQTLKDAGSELNVSNCRPPYSSGKESGAGIWRCQPLPNGLMALGTSWATVWALPDLKQWGLEVSMVLHVFAYSRVDWRLAVPLCKGRPGPGGERVSGNVAMSGIEATGRGDKRQHSGLGS